VSSQADVVILGAGISGIAAALTLEQAGLQVVLLDKGFYPGGRVMSARAHEHTVNPSVDFARVTDATVRAFFDANLSAKLRRRLLTDHGLEIASAGRELAQHLSQKLSVHRTFVTHGITEITPGHPSPVGFGTFGNGPVFLGRHAILTAPPAQSLALWQAEGHAALDAPSVDYLPRMVAICEVNGDVSVVDEHPQSHIIDEIRITKTAESRAVITVFSSGEWASKVWHHDATMSHAQLLREFARWFPGLSVQASQTQRWTYADATSLHPEPFFVVRDGENKVLIAGDGFGASPGREFGVQRAVVSGLASANYLLKIVHD